MDTTDRRKKMGPPAWRANARQHPPKPEGSEPEPVSDELPDGDMAKMALASLVSCIRRPTRHNMARVSAAKALLEYTKAKPATKQDINHSGGLAITVSKVEAPE
jgi:hypothetical protein